jgi:Indigoidine synthase A like protein
MRIGSFLMVHAAVRSALREGRPVVALESAVITHGLPWPENLQLARDMEAAVRAEGAEPATIATAAPTSASTTATWNGWPRRPGRRPGRLAPGPASGTMS